LPTQFYDMEHILYTPVVLVSSW